MILSSVAPYNASSMRVIERYNRNVTPREAAFEEMFRSLGFPFLTADLNALVLELEDPGARASFLSLPLGEPSIRQDAVVAAWSGLLPYIRPFPTVIDQFSETPVMSRFDRRSKFRLMAANSGSSFSLLREQDHVVWQDMSLWPVAFSGFLSQLASLTTLYREAIVATIRDRDSALATIGFSSANVAVWDQTTRMMPTRWHYAFASLGSWLGGCQNFQAGSYYAAAPQLRKRETNVRYGIRLGYLETESVELDRGGLIVIPASVAETVVTAQDGLFFGVIQIDEINLANPPNSLPPNRPELPGWLLDKHYRAPFSARKPESQALYGSRNVLRDHFEQFYSGLETQDLIRCKHYCAPVIEVRSVQEMREHAARIPIHDPEGGIFFRGQTQLYELDRPDKVRMMLFGDSCSSEPSLPTSAARKGFDYDELHFALKYFLAHHFIEFDRGFSSPAENPVYRLWQEKTRSPLCELDFGLMALAQHYGIPTHGLDVTTDLDVATWFATNTYVNKGSGCWYLKMQVGDWSHENSKWPTVLVFQRVTHSLSGSLQDCRELDAFGLKALRPERQKAKFFLGGHSDHQNRLAEALVCVFRLGPGLYDTNSTFEHLFPGPDEDPAYRAMLSFSESDLFRPYGSHHVNRFHSA